MTRYAPLGDIVRLAATNQITPETEHPWLEGNDTPCKAFIAIARRDPWFSDLPAERAEAALICEACPFKDPCRQMAVDNQEAWGIFGGLDFNRAHGNRYPAYCRHGHLLTSENLYHCRTRGSINCRTCQRERQTDGRQANIEAVRQQQKDAAA